MECGIYIIIWLVCGGITAAIASSKGRNAVGWFFVGFFGGLIGIIIAAVMSNLNEEKARFAKIEQDRRRLREQLRQEQIKTEALRLHTSQRLDAHDKVLGVDTRQTSGLLLQGAVDGPKALPGSPEAALSAMAQAGGAPLATPAAPGAIPPVAEELPVWYYENAGRTCGPITQSQVLALVRQGSIHNHTLLWRQGFDDWAPADQVTEFSWAVQA